MRLPVHIACVALAIQTVLRTAAAVSADQLIDDPIWQDSQEEEQPHSYQTARPLNSMLDFVKHLWDPVDRSSSIQDAGVPNSSTNEQGAPYIPSLHRNSRDWSDIRTIHIDEPVKDDTIGSTRSDRDLQFLSVSGHLVWLS